MAVLRGQKEREPVPGGELGRVDGAGAVRVEDA